ncbi:MAG: hypothetical protein QOI73_2524, partial [Solirubrobacteraceae bacterium]|nr:hypothetical protein [Solirubrobacteraceae bacterium]
MPPPALWPIDCDVVEDCVFDCVVLPKITLGGTGGGGGGG